MSISRPLPGYLLRSYGDNDIKRPKCKTKSRKGVKHEVPMAKREKETVTK
jgi:hypothetical protein